MMSSSSDSPDYQFMVGKRLVSDEEYNGMSSEEREEAVPRRVLPKVHRIIKPGDWVQQDYCLDRLNLTLERGTNLIMKAEMY